MIFVVQSDEMCERTAHVLTTASRIRVLNWTFKENQLVNSVIYVGLMLLALVNIEWHVARPSDSLPISC